MTTTVTLVQMRCEKGALGDNLAARKLHIEENGYRYLDMLDIG